MAPPKEPPPLEPPPTVSDADLLPHTKWFRRFADKDDAKMAAQGKKTDKQVQCMFCGTSRVEAGPTR